jgi:hypothetical protein
LEAAIERLEENNDRVEVLVEEPDATRPSVVVTVERGENVFVQRIDMLPLEEEEGVLGIFLAVYDTEDPADLDDAVSLVAESVTLDGDPLYDEDVAGDASDRDAPDGSDRAEDRRDDDHNREDSDDVADEDQTAAGDALLTYESPQFGNTLTFDTAVWRIGEADENPDGPYDDVAFVHPLGFVRLVGHPDYRTRQLDDCLRDYRDELDREENVSDVRELRGEAGRRTTAFGPLSPTNLTPAKRSRWTSCATSSAEDYEELSALREELLEGLDPEGDPDALTTADLLERVETYDDLSQNHVDEPVDYEQSPPVGGEHAPVWQDCGFYDEPVASENAVHSLEHGAVWVTYDPDLPASDVQVLEKLVEGRTHLLVSPFEDLPAPVVASAWGVQLELEDVDDSLLELFILYYEQGPQRPERGATCSGGTSETVS